MTTADVERLEQALERLAENRRDEEAWSSLIAVTFPVALATANRILHGALDLARDATADAFARVAKYANFRVLDLKKADAFIHYLKQVTRRSSLDVLQRLARHSPEIPWDPELLRSLEDRTSPTAEDEVSARELYADIESVLTPEEQTVLELMIKGSSLKEMAEQLGTTPNAAGVRRHRLRAKIREHLSQKQRGPV